MVATAGVREELQQLATVGVDMDNVRSQLNNYKVGGPGNGGCMCVCLWVCGVYIYVCVCVCVCRCACVGVLYGCR